MAKVCFQMVLIRHFEEMLEKNKVEQEDLVENTLVMSRFLLKVYMKGNCLLFLQV